MRRYVENVLRENQPISGNDHQVRLQCLEFGHRVRVTQRLRLQDRNLLLEGVFLDRAGAQFLAATCGPVRLRKDSHGLAAGFHKRLERRQREIRRAGKYDSAHIAAVAAWRRSFSSFLRMRMRLDSER